MEILKNWSICLCVVTFLNLIIGYLLPQGSTAQTIKGITGMLLIVSLLSAVIDTADAMPERSEMQEISIQDSRDDEIHLFAKEMTENRVIEDIGDLLATKDVFDFKINIATDILSDNSIDIKQIDVIVYQELSNREELENALKEYCSVCELICAESEKYENE